MPECYRQAAAGPEPQVPGLEIELSAPNPFQEYQPKTDDREKFPSYQDWHGQAWLPKRERIREAVRCFWVRRLVRFHHGDHIEEEVRSCGKNGGRHFRKLWPSVGPIMQRYAALAWVAAAFAPDYVKFAVDLVYTGQDIVKGRGDVKTKSCLLTWIGPWTADLKGEFTTTPGPRQTPVKDITRELTAAVEVVELWRRMQRHGKWVVTKAGAMDWAMCMEVCPETYQLQGVIRLHLHVFMKGVNYLRIGALSALALEGGGPSQRAHGGRARNGIVVSPSRELVGLFLRGGPEIWPGIRSLKQEALEGLPREPELDHEPAPVGQAYRCPGSPAPLQVQLWRAA